MRIIGYVENMSVIAVSQRLCTVTSIMAQPLTLV